MQQGTNQLISISESHGFNFLSLQRLVYLIEMATADPDVQYAEKPLCPICLDKFKTPRQLPCHHSFCQDCLEDCILSKAANVKELIQFECPVCRNVVPVCNEGKRPKIMASLFPIDLILQWTQGKEAEVKRPCDWCFSEGVSVIAHGFCRNCGEAMCESCLKIHQKLKVSKDHTVLTIKELTTIPENFIGFDRSFHCQEHKDEDLKLYCRDHKTACCLICSSVHHRNCSQILDLTKGAYNLLQEVNTELAIDQMNQLEKHLGNFEKRNELNIVNLESQVQEMTSKIKEIREKLNGFLVDFELKVKSEGDELCKQETIRTQKENHECQALLNAVRNSRVTLETVLQHGHDTKKFLMADKMISQLKIYYDQIKEKFNETETVTFSVEVHSQIQRFLDQELIIGTVIPKRVRECFPLPIVEMPLEEFAVEMEEVVEINGPEDTNFLYTGVTYLQGDEVMLADWNNNKVLLLNCSYQYVSSFTLQDQPYDPCVWDHQEVAVSIPNQKTIQFLSVANGTISPTRKVQTKYECYGIASAGNGKIVLSGPCNEKDKYYWSQITSTGEETCHQFDCQCDHSATYVALNSSCTLVYITVYGIGSLYCFDMAGRKMLTYSHDDLNRPRGVATDRDDRVYVVGYYSHNIHQLSSHNTLRIIKEGVPESPRAICFNQNRDKLLITKYSKERKIYIFCIK